MSKIKILFLLTTGHGVGYYRIQKPAEALRKYCSDDFDVEIKNEVNWNDSNYLKQFDIIHGHRSLVDYQHMEKIVKILKKNGTIVILDIDDYWDVHENHPLKQTVKHENISENIKKNLQMVDAITTTTPIYKNWILPYNKTVGIIENGVDDSEKQWQYEERKIDPNKIKISWAGGSSHLVDLKIMKDGFDKILYDSDTKDKYQIHLTGFDLSGNETIFKLNPDLEKDFAALGILNKKTVNKIHNANYDLSKVKGMPEYLVTKYPNKDNIIFEYKRKIQPKKSVWYDYEQIFTSNYKLIKDKAYLEYLMTFDLDKKYENLDEQPYIRNKTKGVFKFGVNYKGKDIALAPIFTYKHIANDSTNNRFQFAKSNLKLIEAGFHKIPVIASQVPIYTFDQAWQDEKNILFVNPDRQYRDWHKKFKKAIKNPNLIEDMGESAYEVCKAKYDLKVLSEKRADFYKTLHDKHNK